MSTRPDFVPFAVSLSPYSAVSLLETLRHLVPERLVLTIRLLIRRFRLTSTYNLQVSIAVIRNETAPSPICSLQCVQLGWHHVAVGLVIRAAGCPKERARQRGQPLRTLSPSFNALLCAYLAQLPDLLDSSTLHCEQILLLLSQQVTWLPLIRAGHHV